MPKPSRSRARAPFMISRRALGLAVALGLLVSLAVAVARARRTVRPNVLLITVDTLRADHLGCYGYGLPTTPHIDALAREATLFEDAHCQIPKTNPSLASLWTGLYPENHKDLTLRLTLPPAYPVLAERLQAAGYATGAVVGQYNLVRQSGFARGFEDYLDTFPEELPGGERQGRFHPGTEKRATDLTDAALAWLERRSASPFFLWVHYVDPHAAYDPPPPFDHFFPQEHYPATVLDRARIHDQAFDPPRFELAHYVRRYDGEIRYMDTEVGRLLDGLKALGVEEKTLIVFTADHGEYMGETDGPSPEKAAAVPYFSHGTTLTEAETRVPLLWHLPSGWTSGHRARRVRAPVELVDVTPTLLELLRLPSIRSDGHSLLESVSLGREPEAGGDRAYSYSFESNSVSLETSRWKLVEYPNGSVSSYVFGLSGFPSFEGGRRTRLFDRTDSGVPTDVSGAHADVAEQLREELLDRLRKAPGPRNSAVYPVNQPWDDTSHLKRLRSLGYI